MSTDSERPRSYADVAREHPQGFRELVEIAEREGESELARLMREAMREAEGGDSNG